MDFVMLFQLLGEHIPALGAFIVSCLIFGFGWYIAFRLGRRASDKAWKWDCEHNPELLKQNIREAYERRVTELETRNKYLQERHDTMVPAFQQMALAAQTMADHLVRQ